VLKTEKLQQQRMNRILFAITLLAGLLTKTADGQDKQHQKAIEYTGKGIELSAKDSFNSAIEWFTKAIIADSTYEEAYYGRGNAYMAALIVEDGLKDYRWLVLHYTQHADIYAKMGDYCQTGINNAGCVNYYNTAIRLDSGQGSYFAKRGLLLFDLGKFKEAIPDLEKAISLNYTSAEIFSKTGYAYSRIDNNKMAVYYFDKAIEKNPKSMEDYANRGNALVAIHQLDAAKEDLMYYLKYDSTDASVWYNLARAQYGLQDFDGSIASLKKALYYHPAYEDSWFRMGLAYGEKGDYQHAVSSFTQAIIQSPNEAYLYYNLAVAKAKANPDSDYCTDLKKAARMGYPDAIKMMEKACKN
jgi:tetratricopeptide (TPR) repeat protein